MALDSTLASTSTEPAVSAPAPSTPSLHRYRDAYERAFPATQALKPEDIISVNLDVPSAVTTTLGKLPAILSLRSEVAKHLPTFELSSLDLLETYTLALGQAHALFLGASAAPAQLATLNERALLLRDVLSTDAQALAKHGLINGSRLKALKANVGYKNLAFDLFGL